MLDSIFSDNLQKKYWYSIFENFYKFRVPDTWDYAWVLTCLINNGLTAIPNKNLIRNIGFNLDATHTKWPINKVNKVSGIGGSLVDPKFIVCDLEAEKYQFDFFFGGFSKRLKKSLLRIKK